MFFVLWVSMSSKAVKSEELWCWLESCRRFVVTSAIKSCLALGAIAAELYRALLLFHENS